MAAGLGRLLRLASCVAVAAASAEDAAVEGSCPAGGCTAAAGAATAFASKDVAWRPKTLSVVLPCAGEGEFALKTARAVAESVPGGGGGETLSEIIIVDDGSSPPVASIFPAELQKRYGVRIVRHDKPKGLIQAKAAGASHTTGDVIVFFDCHVGPQPGWHSAFLKAIAPNYRRIVVPAITNLDIDTWTQQNDQVSVNKCYLTWDADFKWFRSKDDFMPVLSGGLLGISRQWWQETGGYDSQMENWGGENIDQSLRTWLCGGEILSVPQAEVAHMWRKPDDPRTQSNYHIDVLKTLQNRARAAKGWFGNFTFKLDDYPDMQYIRWHKLDTSEFDAVRERLGCRPFAWFLWRFRTIYENAGLVPENTFNIRHIKSGKCLTYLGPPGTHPQGQDKITLTSCGADPSKPSMGRSHRDAQRWHRANQGDRGECCSGYRVWNTDQCLSIAGAVQTHICEVSGRMDQLLRLTTADEAAKGIAPGQLRHPSGMCLVIKNKAIVAERCKEASSPKVRPVWEITDEKVPREFELYQQAKLENPSLFVE